MKKPIFIFCITLFYSTSWGQTIEENYIKSTIYKSETQTGNVPAGEKIETVAYYDGLGRPMQTVGYKAGGSSQDIITPIVYDELGRQVREYLPYAAPQQSGNSMSYRDNEMVVLPALEGYYLDKYPAELDPNAPNPYSEKVIEASPLNRVLEQGAPGESWKADPLSDTDHTVKFGYLSNNTGEVRRFGVSHPGGDTERTKLEHEGYYLADQLYKVVTKDENWQPGQQYGKDHTTEEFTDKLGRVVLKRTYDKNIRHDTYYVYDDYGNLTYVLPPMASAELAPGVSISVSKYRAWTHLVQVDAEFAEEYDQLLQDYEDEQILNADIENEYGGQGGFNVSTTAGSDEVTLGITFSANMPFELKTGEVYHLEEHGEFPDNELGRLSGEEYEYTFTIRDNTIYVEGEGTLSALNQTFTSGTELAYSHNYPWTAYTEVEPGFAEYYEGELEAYENEQWLTANIPNEHNGHGGLNISIDANDKITLNISSSLDTPFALKNGLVFPLHTERRVADRDLGSLSGPGYHYNLAIRENSFLIEGEGAVTNVNAFFSTIAPQNSEEQAILEGLCYIYHYDHRNRVVEKKIPGKGWEHIVYNKLDQPVLTQNANQRVNNNWLFTKYNAFGKVAYSGVYTPMGSMENYTRKDFQNEIDTNLNYEQYEERSPNKAIIGTQYNNVSAYYTNYAFPNYQVENNMKVDIIYYYGTYPDNPNDPNDIESLFPDPGTVYGEATTDQVKTLPTASKIRVLSTNEWILSATYYDEKGRAIYTATENEYLNTEDVVMTDLDFTGKVLKTQSTHAYGNKAPITVEDTFTYDHMQRLLTQVQTINGGTPELIVNNTYDELGQLVSKKVGGAVAATPENSPGLQTIDYTYNIRGWLKGINEVLPYIGGEDYLFAFEIGYDQPETALTPLYNGNISETHWITQSDGQTRSYAYEYDALNRIYAAYFDGGLAPFAGPGVRENYSLSQIAYDKNGNITALERYGVHFDTQDSPQSVDIIDDLSYFYAPLSNQLMKVGDTAYEEGFKNGTNSGDDYAYDFNGNLVMDKNKEIANIYYNYLNLPQSIVLSSPPMVEADRVYHNYSAEGIKQQKQVVTNNSSNIQTTDYAGNFIYEDGELRQFFTPEGYVQPVDPDDYSQGFDYVYQYKDHLGNVRLSYSDTNGNGNIDPATEILDERNYYPFGLEHKGYNNVVTGAENNYQTFQGVEFNESLGLNLYEMDFRQYDPAIGRFNRLDPVTHHSVSPYIAFDNNPAFWSDPSGADATSLINDLWNRSGNGTTKWTNNNDGTFSSSDGQTAECDDCQEQPKYQFYGISTTGDMMYLNFDKKTFNIMTAYGEDPQDLYESKIGSIYKAFKGLKKTEQIKVLKWLGVPKSLWGKIAKSSSPASFAASLINAREDGLAALPVVGGIFEPVNSMFRSNGRMIDNMNKWESVQESYGTLMNTEILNDVIIIYSNENLFKQSSINTNAAEMLDSRYPTGTYKYAYYGTQYGQTLYIYGRYNINN